MIARARHSARHIHSAAPAQQMLPQGKQFDCVITPALISDTVCNFVQQRSPTCTKKPNAIGFGHALCVCVGDSTGGVHSDMQLLDPMRLSNVLTIQHAWRCIQCSCIKIEPRQCSLLPLCKQYSNSCQVSLYIGCTETAAGVCSAVYISRMAMYIQPAWSNLTHLMIPAARRHCYFTAPVR